MAEGATPVPEGGPGRDAEAVDALARWAVARARPIRVDLVDSEDDLARVHRLRHRAVVEQAWADADALPGGLERDEDDEVAVHVAAWDGPEVVGTVRVVLPAPGRRLPTERAFDIVAEPRGRVADWGRLVVNPGHRDGGHVVMLALLGRAWLSTREHGATACIGVATPAVLERYRSLGVEATVLAGPRLHWGEQRYAARLLGVAADAGARMGGVDATRTAGGSTGAHR